MNLNALRERVRLVVDDLVAPDTSDVEVGDLTDALREVADGLEDLDRLAHTLAGALDCEPELGVLADRVDVKGRPCGDISRCCPSFPHSVHIDHATLKFSSPCTY